MRNVRLPEGARISITPKEYSRATRAGGGWAFAGILFCIVAFGSTDGDSDVKVTHTDKPRPAATQNR